MPWLPIIHHTTASGAWSSYPQSTPLLSKLWETYGHRGWCSWITGLRSWISWINVVHARNLSSSRRSREEVNASSKDCHTVDILSDYRATERSHYISILALSTFVERVRELNSNWMEYPRTSRQLGDIDFLCELIINVHLVNYAKSKDQEMKSRIWFSNRPTSIKKNSAVRGSSILWMIFVPRTLMVNKAVKYRQGWWRSWGVVTRDEAEHLCSWCRKIWWQAYKAHGHTYGMNDNWNLLTAWPSVTLPTDTTYNQLWLWRINGCTPGPVEKSSEC